MWIKTEFALLVAMAFAAMALGLYSCVAHP